jgi:hypothetical protein
MVTKVGSRKQVFLNLLQKWGEWGIKENDGRGEFKYEIFGIL